MQEAHKGVHQICVVGVHNLHSKSMLDNFLVYLELIQTTFDELIHNFGLVALGIT
jgi:hypothetical protein